MRKMLFSLVNENGALRVVAVPSVLHATVQVTRGVQNTSGQRMVAPSASRVGHVYGLVSVPNTECEVNHV